jgi:hypothetical protein
MYEFCLSALSGRGTPVWFCSPRLWFVLIRSSVLPKYVTSHYKHLLTLLTDLSRFTYWNLWKHHLFASSLRITWFPVSSISIVTMPTGWTTKVRFPAGAGIFFLFATASRTALGAVHPPVQWVPGVLSPGIKLPGCEPDHSLPPSAEDRYAWCPASTSPTSSWRGSWLSTRKALPLSSNKCFLFPKRQSKRR